MQQSRGSQLLAAAGNSRSIATAAGVDPRSARAWIRGEKTPSLGAQEALRAAFGISPSAWGERPHDVVAPPAEPEREPPEARSPATDGTEAPRVLPVPCEGFGADVLSLARMTRKLIADLEGPEGAALSLGVRSKLLNQAGQTLQRLGAKSCDNLAGLTQEAVETSPSWTVLLVRIERALEPFPDALRAVAAALSVRTK